jgi:hypothetical protein
MRWRMPVLPTIFHWTVMPLWSSEVMQQKNAQRQSPTTLLSR